MAALADLGISDVTRAMLARWRRAKLLGPVKQRMTPGGGSVVLHPPDTSVRVAAIRHLQQEKDDLGWIGVTLWWRFHLPIDEALWRPLLIQTANEFGPVLATLRELVAEERESDELDQLTLADQTGPHLEEPNIILSRLLRRVPAEELQPVLRLIIQAAGGEPPQFEAITGDEREPRDQALLVKALGIAGSPQDILGGKSFRFAEAIGPVLEDIAISLQDGRLIDAATAERAEIEAARDELQQVFEIAVRLYEALKPTYGDGAFGLRLADWVVRKSPPELIRLYVLLWVLLRRSTTTLISRSEVETLNSNAVGIAQLISRIEQLATQNPSSELAIRKYLKRLFQGRISFTSLLQKLESLGVK